MAYKKNLGKVQHFGLHARRLDDLSAEGGGDARLFLGTVRRSPGNIREKSWFRVSWASHTKFQRDTNQLIAAYTHTRARERSGTQTRTFADVGKARLAIVERMVQRLLEAEVLDAPAELVQVQAPLDRRHVEVEPLAILRRERVEEPAEESL